MGREQKNRGRWPGAADHASHDAAQLRPPLPVQVAVKAYRVMGATVVEVTATVGDDVARSEYVARTHVPGALLDLPTYHHILAALGDELHGLARHMKSLVR